MECTLSHSLLRKSSLAAGNILARSESWGGGVTQLPVGGYSTGQPAGRHRHNRFASSAQDPAAIVVTADFLVDSISACAGHKTGPEPARDL
jgi:hypothetical protein